SAYAASVSRMASWPARTGTGEAFTVTAPSTAWASEFAALAASFASGWEADSAGSLITIAARTFGVPGGAPAAWRWPRAISAALSVVGMAAARTGGPSTAAGAFGTAVTAPP